MGEILRVSIDRTACAGHGRCYDRAADVFGCDDEGYGVVLTQPSPDQYGAVRSAAGNCPEQAVILLTTPEEMQAR